MKRLTGGLYVVLILLLVLGLAGEREIPPVEAVTTEEVKDYPILTVNGEGTISVSPDQARISFAVVTEAKTAKDAQQKNTSIMNSLIGTLQKKGLTKKDIQTYNFRIYPRYDYEVREGHKEEKLIGYRVYHELKVTVNDIEEVGKIIDLGISEGVNRVNYVEFYLENDDIYRKKALTQAVLNAKEKAQVMAEALQSSISGIVRVQEGGVSYPQPLIKSYHYDEASFTGAGGSTPINPGDLKIRANVRIDYKLSK